MGMAMIIFLKLCLVSFFSHCLFNNSEFMWKIVLTHFHLLHNMQTYGMEIRLGDRLRINGCCNVLLSFNVASRYAHNAH